MHYVSEFMGRDHKKLDEICNECKLKKRDGPDWRKLFNEFKSGLERHLNWEEKVLFPVLEKRIGKTSGGPTEILRNEHRQMKALISKIESYEKPDPELEEKLLDVLSLHNLKEESILYPWLDNVLVEEERARIISQCIDWTKGG